MENKFLKLAHELIGVKVHSIYCQYLVFMEASKGQFEEYERR
jgi:hypothetical protein